jgi:hypothetical protein
MAGVLLVTLSGCGGSQKSNIPAVVSNGTVPSSVTPVGGYAVSVFAGASQAGTSTHPDSIIKIGSNIFVGYGDSVNPDGTVAGSNPPTAGHCEIIEYDLTGKPLKTFTITGHNDGLLAYDSQTIWAMSNEDANPTLTIINLATGTQTQYTPTTPVLHGGGLDDMALINGKVFVSASNPTLSPSNTPNGASAVISLSLNANGHTFDWAPVLSGTAQATDVVSGSTITLNLTDPDSEAVDPSGNLVLDSQGDSELIFISNPGSSNQAATRLSLSLYTNPWPVDDTRFVPTGTNPYMLFTDTPSNTIYRVDALFKAGDAYSAGEGTLLKLDPTSGNLTPIIDGLGSPHGILFVTQ